MEKEYTAQPKQNWFKAHMKVCIISAVVVIAAIVLIVLILNNIGSKSPEDVMKTYVEAMQEGNVDKIMKITDTKGVLAWENCGENASEFEEEYKNISDEEAKEYEKKTKDDFEIGMNFFKTLGGKVEITINNIETPEELAKDLYKVKASIEINSSVFGVDQEQEKKDITLVVYKGKYIGEFEKIIGNNPEEVVKNYIEAMQEADTDKMVNMTDIKGAYAWKQCDGNVSEFDEEYKKISKNEEKKIEEKVRASIEYDNSFIKNFGGVEMSIENIEKPEKLAKNLYKVKVSVKMKISVLGKIQEQDQDMTLVVYNGKYIGEAGE